MITATTSTPRPPPPTATPLPPPSRLPRKSSTWPGSRRAPLRNVMGARCGRPAVTAERRQRTRALQPAVAVQPREVQVPEVREHQRAEADHQDERRGAAGPAALVPRVHVDGVDQPRHE